ncbi:hypothetical protein FNV43_RR07223 [Rhamnella rubrinervis]|uniref:DC-UbP/UBTD2 N-terminal domain-containing protein n=1 Tax=Rhamnella rubrinervis TaxID=2594499 RepID=A0A8K0MMI0_9ROSA|nr:hypothetical protein FNV43_RR07223 [Rhamnella rubrinervis]
MCRVGLWRKEEDATWQTETAFTLHDSSFFKCPDQCPHGRAAVQQNDSFLGSIDRGVVSAFGFISVAAFFATMGCAGSSRSKEDENIKHIRKPKPWKHLEPISRTQLMQMRDEFWDTAPHYGGNKEIWDALRAAAEADLKLAQAIVDSAGVIVQSADLTICYDERGARYELPNYVLSEPTNLIKDV